MDSVLDHISSRKVAHVTDRWMPVSELFTRDVTSAVDYGTRYRLELRSSVEYIIGPSDVDSPIHPAHDHARRQLIRHLYGEQLEIGHELMSALYGGADRQKVSSIVGKLLESMRDDRRRD